MFLLVGGFLVSLPKSAKATGASLYLSPTSGSFVADSTFDVSILVNTGGAPINAVSADLTFPTNQLQIVGPESSSSFISVWIAQPTFSNSEGKINLSGGLPTPGVNTSAGNVLTIHFRAKSPGQAKIHFQDSSKVLANDGNGTNILSSTNDASFNITAKPPAGPTISSATHPDQNSWYNNKLPQFSWESPGAKAISYAYDKNPSTEPDTTAEQFTAAFSAAADSDGVWYLHLRVQANGVWGGTSHYKTQIDVTSPAKFTPLIEPARVTVSQRPVVSFQTTDAASGVDHYEIKVESLGNSQTNAGFFTEQQSPYILPVLQAGEYRVSVRAYDKAGNLSEGSANISIVGTGTTQLMHNIWFLLGIAIVILAIITLIIWWIIRRRRRKNLMEPAASQSNYI